METSAAVDRCRRSCPANEELPAGKAKPDGLVTGVRVMLSIFANFRTRGWHVSAVAMVRADGADRTVFGWDRCNLADDFDLLSSDR